MTICIVYTKNVYMLSTVPTKNECEPVSRMVKKDGKWAKINVDRPIILGLYKKYMGGVDVADKKFVRYKRQTKSLKWYHKVTWYMMAIAIFNTFIMHISIPNNRKTKLREFRDALYAPV